MRELLSQILDRLNAVILGKTEPVELAVTCLLAQGHLLVEDIPGVGKTTLVKALSQLMDLDCKRVQFTNDLLPADIIGTSIYDTGKNQFSFHAGPIFTQVLIADELNRGTPRTQSAFLQAMEERRVSVDGVTYSLPDPFFVVATQNPQEQLGTHPLPESQLDRFLMRIGIGFPAPEFERQILKTERSSHEVEGLTPILDADRLIRLQHLAMSTFVSDPLIDYLQRLLQASRVGGARDNHGLSPRAGIALLKCSKAYAFLRGRDKVLPEDLQKVAPSVMVHRLQGHTEQVEAILKSVPVD